MKKATRKKLIDWVITIALTILLAYLVWVRFVRPSTQSATSDATAPPHWVELNVTATVEIAETDEARQRGLMGRESLDRNHGMYFLYPELHPGYFHMRNTRIPLSIAFLDAEGVILDIRDMQPFDETPVRPAAGQFKDTLEMNQGWFAEHGLQAGDRIELAHEQDVVRFQRFQ